MFEEEQAGASACSELFQLPNLLKTILLFHMLESHCKVITTLYMSAYVSSFTATLMPSATASATNLKSPFKCWH